MKSDYQVVLSIVLAVIILFVLFFALDKSVGIGQDEEQTAELTDSLAAPVSSQGDSISEQRVAHLQPFDPNTADEALLKDLGFTDFTIYCLLRYREKGGVFQKKEQLAQIHGMTYEKYQQVEPYISIAPKYLPASDFVSVPRDEREALPRDTIVYPKKLEPGQFVSLNTADTTELKTIPGIGSYYAGKIVELRSRYGGFVSLDQLLDINNFPEQSLEYLSLSGDSVTKININTADFRTLQRHPYIGYSRARQITQYVELKGQISSLEELSLLPGFSLEERQRLEPYIEY